MTGTEVKKALDGSRYQCWSYEDFNGFYVSLTNEEITWFFGVVADVLNATGISIIVTPCDHERIAGNTEALGLYWWVDGEGQSHNFISIDTYFIHERYGVEVEGKHSIEPQTLAEVICHELAHRLSHCHTKKHAALTLQYIAMAAQ